jgi:hypothetical protein
VYPQRDSLTSYWPSGPYDAGMQLDRSRTALQQAAQAVEELRAAKNNPDLFRDKFPSTMGMVLRVGSIAHHETEGRRTFEFGDWWRETQRDPLFVFMQDVRNAEFKRAERRQRAAHHVSVTSQIGISSSVTWEQRDKDGRVLGRRRRWDPPFPEPPPSSPRTTVIQSTDWYFWGGGQYDGQEVFALLDRYIAWLCDDILPMAERLTR